MNTDPIFDGKSLPDLFSEIYRNSTSKRDMINVIITKLLEFAKNPEDAAIIFPIIQHFIDTSVKNDGHIIDIAQIVQKIQSASVKAEGGSMMLSEEEKQELLRVVSESIDIHEDPKTPIMLDRANEIISPKTK